MPSAHCLPKISASINIHSFPSNICTSNRLFLIFSATKPFVSSQTLSCLSQLDPHQTRVLAGQSCFDPISFVRINLSISFIIFLLATFNLMPGPERASRSFWNASQSRTKSFSIVEFKFKRFYFRTMINYWNHLCSYAACIDRRRWHGRDDVDAVIWRQVDQVLSRPQN